jgi:phosphoribosylformimino-5-aminoimidazole carboxamide ribotide isomerase
VHAFRGEREHYRPVKSVLCDTPDPFAVARAFRDRLGLNEIYIADLDSIQNSNRVSHREAIAALALREKIHIILDAGATNVENTRALLDLGVRKVVIGSETLGSWDALRDIPARINCDSLVFSLDFRAGKILSRCPVLAAMPVMDVLEHLQSAGWQEVILLDLGRVGSGEGVNRRLAAESCAHFPDLNLLVGGGIAGPEQFSELQYLGIAGILVATALHRGTINAKHISTLGQ